MKKRFSILLVCMLMVLSMVTTVGAKPIVESNSSDIINISDVLLPINEQPDALVNNEQSDSIGINRMGSGYLLYNATFSNLSAGNYVTTVNTHIFRKSDFTNLTLQLGVTTNGNCNAGLCYVDSNGTVVKKCYSSFSSSGTTYLSVSSLDANTSYYGFITNTGSSSISGQASFYDLR